jgi:hypothetical protein
MEYPGESKASRVELYAIKHTSQQPNISIPDAGSTTGNAGWHVAHCVTASSPTRGCDLRVIHIMIFMMA